MKIYTSSCTSKISFFLLIAVGLLLPRVSWQQVDVKNTLVLSDEHKMIRNIQDRFLVFEDTASLSFDEVLKLPDSTYKINKSNLLENTEATYWIKFYIKNATSRIQHRVINFNDPDFEQIEVIGAGKHFISGTQYSFWYRPIIHKNFVFDFTLEPRQTVRIMARLRSEFHSSFSTDLSTTSELLAYSLTEYYLLGIFYGVIFILSIYNVILYFTDKNKTYLYYVFYILSCALFALNEDGLGFQFLWRNVPSMNKVIYHLAPLALLITFVLYASSFTGLRRYEPKKYRILLGSVVAFLVYYLFHFVIIPANPFWFAFYIVPFGICYWFTLRLRPEGRKTRLFFLTGSTIILLSFMIYLLRLLNLIPSGILPVYSFNFAFIIEAVVLSMAVGQQVKTTIQRNEAAQRAVIKGLEENELLKDKVNRELESKVMARTRSLKEKTIALEVANTKMKKLQQELYAMNEQLDVSNYRLKKEVQLSTRQMITSKELTLEQFLEVFPSKVSCYEFVAEAKWSSHKFACKKCRASEFKEKDRHERVCKKCGTPHSLTSDTLFHALKLDIRKALYLAYIINLNQQKYTIDELAQLLEISRNSAWSFKKKIVTQKAKLQQSSGKKSISLEELIVG